MSKYRIVEHTSTKGAKSYTIEEKVLWWWLKADLFPYSSINRFWDYEEAFWIYERLTAKCTRKIIEP